MGKTKRRKRTRKTKRTRTMSTTSQATTPRPDRSAGASSRRSAAAVLSSGPWRHCVSHDPRRVMSGRWSPSVVWCSASAILFQRMGALTVRLVALCLSPRHPLRSATLPKKRCSSSSRRHLYAMYMSRGLTRCKSHACSCLSLLRKTISHALSTRTPSPFCAAKLVAGKLRKCPSFSTRQRMAQAGAVRFLAFY